MEGAENKIHSIPQNKKIFQGVKKAVIQLNIWVTSIDLSFRNALLTKHVDKETTFREIFDKMNTHYDRMARIVQICQDLSKKNKVKEMDLINEFISYVIDRFKTLHKQIELTFKKTAIENINNKCEAIFMKINDCNKNFQSLSNLVLKTKKVPEGQNTVEDQIQHLKYLFNQYSEDIEKIKTKVQGLTDKSYEEFVINVKEVKDTLFLIKTTIDQQWLLIIQIYKPFRNKRNPFVKVLDEPLDTAKPMDQNICLNAAILSSDPSVEIYTLEDRLKYRTVVPKRILQIVHRNSAKCVFQIGEIFFWTIEQHFNANSYFKADSFFVLTPRSLESLSINKCVHLKVESKLKVSTKFHRSELNHKCRFLQNDSQFPRRSDLTSQSSFTTLMGRFPPNRIFFKYLNSSIKMIKENHLNLNDKLYKNHLEFEFSSFENQYEFLSENNSLEFLLTSTLDEMVEAGVRRSNRVTDNLKWNAIFLARKAVNKFSKINFLHEIFPVQIPTRKGMLQWLVNFVRRNIQFDLSLACLILMKEVMSYFCNKFHFKEILNSALEIREYRSLSTTI